MIAAEQLIFAAMCLVAALAIALLLSFENEEEQ
jgi:hypothetical protein